MPCLHVGQRLHGRGHLFDDIDLVSLRMDSLSRHVCYKMAVTNMKLFTASALERIGNAFNACIGLKGHPLSMCGHASQQLGSSWFYHVLYVQSLASRYEA